MNNGKQLLRLVERADSVGTFRIRWDSLYLRPATQSSAEVFAQMLHFTMNANSVEIILLRKGDTLLIDNWRMLHGRSSTNHNALTRHIERAYMGSIT